jgi:hypothetical protein
MHGCCLSVHLRLIWSFMVTKLDLFGQFSVFVLILGASFPFLADFIHLRRRLITEVTKIWPYKPRSSSINCVLLLYSSKEHDNMIFFSLKRLVYMSSLMVTVT